MNALRAAGRAAVTTGRSDTIVGPLFVFWAAQEFRESFDPETRANAHFTWDFLFREQMRLPPGWLDAHNAEATGRRLAEAGLRALRRPVRIDTAGSRQFLRSIVAEGGIPRSLLRQDTAYRRTVLAALEEFEAMRVLDHGAAVVAVSRHDGGFAQVFQSEDIRHLVADLVLKLAELRAAVPERARTAPEIWLDATRPGWRAELPMRLDEAVARLLVADALVARRRPDADDKLVTRLLVRGSDGIWQSRIRLGQRALLPLARLSPIIGPEATSARLLPDHPLAMHLKGAALRAELDRDERTWTVSLVGPGAGVAFPFALEDPASFSVLVDGWNCGGLVPAGGEGAEDSEISFWSPESLPDKTEAKAPGNGPLRRIGTGSIATRSPVVSMLVPAKARVSATGLALAGPEAAGNGAVYHMRGQGEVSVDGETLRVRTGANKESAHTLAAAGRTVARTTDGAGNPVYLGAPAFSIHSLHGLSRPAAARQLLWGNRAFPARPIEASRPPFGTGTLAYRDAGETIARGRFSIVPKGFSCRLSLADRETRLVVEIDGLPVATVVSLFFGSGAPARAGIISSEGAARLEVVLGAEVPPEQLVIGLKSAEGALDLRIPFPSSRGSFVGPDGKRLVRARHIGIARLDDWRALAPELGARALSLATGSIQVEFKLDSPIPLASFRDVVAALLLVSSDAGVTATIYANGLESAPLIVHKEANLDFRGLARHFGHDQETDRLQTGIPPCAVSAPSAAIFADLLERPIPEARAGFLAAERFPIDWALLPITAWSSGIATAASNIEQALCAAGLPAKAAAIISEEEIVTTLAAMVELRPELSMHAVGSLFGFRPSLFQKLLRLLPAALVRLEPLEDLARTMITHFPGDFPQAFRDVRARAPQPRLQAFHPAAQSILEAPFVAAEIALGRRPAANARTVAALATFRHYDPHYFEHALPVAMKTLGSTQ